MNRKTTLSAIIIAVALVAAFTLSAERLSADELSIDLNAADAAKQWKFMDDTASIKDGCLQLDGRRESARAVYLPLEWKDVALEAKFKVEPQNKGVLACGFMVGTTDADHFDYVHLDRTQAILVRSDKANQWNEIKRVGKLDKPAGKWHTAKLERRGDTLAVSLNGKLLYEAKSPAGAAGRIGFYAGQGLVEVKDIVVSGAAKKATSEFKVPPPNFVYVCKDAGAGAYEAFPDVCRLSDGRLMAVFYAGYGHVALPNAKLPKGGRISYCISSDEGKTWTPAKVLYDGPNDDRDPSIMQLPDGRLLCTFFTLIPTKEPGKRWTCEGTSLIESSDLGKTWSKPRIIYPDYYVSAPIRVLSDGRLALGLYSEKANTAFGAIGLSDDNGKTWKKVVDIDNGGVRLDAETDLIELKDGSLYAVLRAKACYSVSKDRGESWTVSKPIGFAAHCPYLLRTDDDIILLAHRLPKTSLHYSLDECKTWSDNVMVDGVIGAYPSMVKLKDGSILIIYYEEGAGSSIRAKKFRASKDGIEWLTF
ncbi:MAG: sialidase family protein [Planctomycetota bacterium]|nr:sialidase family protein [Planctomycetota bacterium]